MKLRSRICIVEKQGQQKDYQNDDLGTNNNNIHQSMVSSPLQGHRANPEAVHAMFY